MQISDIISAILAGLTFLGITVALILGVKSLRENRMLQRREYKNKLLEEILDWILSIAKCGFILVAKDWITFKTSTATVRDMKNTQSIGLGNLQMALLEAWYKGRYIRPLSQALGKDIEAIIDDIIEQVSREIDECDHYKNKFSDLPDDLEQFNAVMKEWVEVSKKSLPAYAKTIYKGIEVLGKYRAENLK